MKATCPPRARGAFADADGRLQARTLAERSGTLDTFPGGVPGRAARRGPRRTPARPALALTPGDVILVIDVPLTPVRCTGNTVYGACT